MKKKLMKEGYGWRQTGLFSFTKDYVEKNFDFVKDTVEEWEDEMKRRNIKKWAKEITEFFQMMKMELFIICLMTDLLFLQVG